jgi:enamine deaminase RidA (YjgF/YER057c/UK114 family)
MSIKVINPEALGFPRGYSNGVIVDSPGRLLFIAGQVAWDATQQIVSEDLVTQFDRALGNVIAVVTEAGGSPDRIVRMTIYVTNVEEYRAATSEIGERYRNRMGKHFPAMVLVEVSELLEPGAKIEIDATAVL